MKFKKTIISLLLAISIFLLNLPQTTVASVNYNLNINIGDKATFEEGTILKDFRNDNFYLSENSSSVAQYSKIELTSNEYCLPNYSQLSSEYKTALEASGYVLPEDGKIKWVVERKEDKIVACQTSDMDGNTINGNEKYPVFKIYPYILYDVSINSNIANGSITADKPNVTCGETVTLTIAPNDHCKFETIAVKDKDNNAITLSGTGNTRTFIMPESKALVTGSFSKIPHNVEVDSSIANGSIKADKPNAIGGETVTLTIAPNDNYKLETITVKDGDNKEITLSGLGNIRTFIMPESKASGTGSFSKIQYNVEVDSSIVNGSITADKPNATSGETVTLTIAPSDHYQLESIVVKDGNNNAITLSGTGNTRTFTMPESKVSVIGSFLKIQYNVEVDSGIVNGSIKADKPNATSGETVTLTIAPSDNYQLEGITVKDKDNNAITLSGTGNTRTFIMPGSKALVTGSFQKIPQVVDNVVLTPETAVVQKGKTQSFTASVSGNYSPEQSVKWSVEGASSNDTTISESGVLKVSSNEMSSTLKVRATSTFDNTKSSVSVVTVIRANLIPGTTSNTISGIKEGDSFIVGTEISFAAIGGGIDNTSPISGDVRYVPISWSVNSNGEWATAPYTAKFTTNNVGNYTLKVLYQKQIFNGTLWENIANEIDTKTVSFSDTNKPLSDQDVPGSGDQASILLYLCAGIIAAVSARYMHLAKKRSVKK